MSLTWAYTIPIRALRPTRNRLTTVTVLEPSVSDLPNVRGLLR